MNGSSYFLDTNIILYILSGDVTIATYLHQKNLYTSVICEIEALGYKTLSAKEEKTINSFLSQFRIIYLDETIKKQAIQIRKDYSLKLPDCIIAASAISLNIPLITADKRFTQINNLQLELYQI